MEGFLIFVYVIMLVWGVLNIVLFFKIWSMTNDVNVIKQHLLGKKTTPYEREIKTLSQFNNFKVGDKVEHECYNRDKAMFIGRINDDGTCLCVDEKGEAIATYSIKKLTKVE